MPIRGVSLLDTDSDKEITFEFTVQAHDSTKLNVMYTNNPDSVKLRIAKFKQYLQEEKHKVVGLDLVPSIHLLTGTNGLSLPRYACGTRF